MKNDRAVSYKRSAITRSTATSAATEKNKANTATSRTATKKTKPNTSTSHSATKKTKPNTSTSRSATKKTKPTVVSEKVLTGLNVPIDVNFDRSKENSNRARIENQKQHEAILNADQNEKKNGKTLVVIALMTIFLFLLAGLSIKFTNSTVNTSLAAFFGSSEKTTTGSSAPAITADDALGSLSDILSSRISLISSKNPKFIVTKEGQKIVPNDVIDGSLTVVDIFTDHILVTSNGVNLKIAY